MTNDPMLQVTPHPDEQRSPYALREEFRAANQQRIHDALLTHPIGWGVLGDPALARDKFTAEEWAIQLLNHLDAPVEQDFGLNDAPKFLSERLEELAQKAALHDSVTWTAGTEGAVDLDAPPCPSFALMTDDEICDYVDRSIRESRSDG